MNRKSLTVTTYLWKEWRDHRAIAIAYAIAAPLLIALLYTCIGEGWWATSRDWPTIGAFAGFAIAALAFGADLVPGEMRRNKLVFLARMPSDLGGAFVAKLAFFVAMLVAFAGWTFVAATTAGALFMPGPWFPSLSWSQYGLLGWGALVGASWILAVSCWMPRGTFALPATALALAAWLAPVVGAFLLNPDMKLREGEVERVATWLAIAGVGVAALSFLRGWRHGGTLRSRITWSLGPALLAFAPVWGWAGVRLHEYRHLDPSESDFRIHATAFGAGGRFAFVNGYHELVPAKPLAPHAEWGAPHPLIVDVATGSWREVGNPGDLFWHVGRQWERASVRSVLLVADKHDPRVPIASQFKDGFDAGNGEPMSAAQWKVLLRGASGDEFVLNRESDFTNLADGRRVWVADGKLLVQTPDGEQRELHCDVNDRWIWPIGCGIEGEGAFYDCSRERAWSKQEIVRFVNRVVLVRAGRWLVSRTHSGTREGELRTMALWDPETRELSPVLGLKGVVMRGLHPDGRLLVVEPAKKPGDVPASDEIVSGAFVLLDPESGARRELPLPPALAANLRDGWCHGFTASGDLLLTLYEERDQDLGAHSIVWFARLDPHDDGLACVGPFVRTAAPNVLGCPDRDTVVFVEDDRRLLRAHFDGAPTETLFPR